MNNCPKCGNPLQEGTNNCPICGTNILDKQLTTEIKVTTPSTPVANAAPVEAPAQPAGTTPEASQPVQPQAPVVTVPTTAAPVTPEASIAATGAQENTGILPTVERVEAPTPIPSIPSSLSTTTVGINEVKPLVPNPKLEPKKTNKKTPLIVGLILIVVLGVGCFMFLKPSKPKMNNNKANESAEPVALSSMSSNGYHLKVAEGWLLNEDGTNVILTNTDETVAIKLEHYKASLSTIKQTDIEAIMGENSVYQDVKVNEVDVSGRSSYLVSTNINSIPVQIYFINGGPELIIGATIVYQSEDTKTKYEPTVMEMIVSLSYTDDSIKAIETMNQYSQMFGIFNNVTYNATNKEIPPSENQPEENGVPEEQQPENNPDANNQPE